MQDTHLLDRGAVYHEQPKMIRKQCSDGPEHEDGDAEGDGTPNTFGVTQSMTEILALRCEKIEVEGRSDYHENKGYYLMVDEASIRE